MNTHEFTPQTTATFIGGGSTGQNAAEYKNAIEDAAVYAVVGMADSGSRTGDLRVLCDPHPVGDVRRSLSALSANSYAAYEFEHRFGATATLDEALAAVDAASERFQAALSYSDSELPEERISEIFQRTRDLSADIYRRDPNGLKGFALGHLVLGALAAEHDNFQDAVFEANQLMVTRGEVIPATLVPHHLVMADGDQLIIGEGDIDHHVIQHPDNVEVGLMPLNPFDRVTINPRAEEVISPSQKAIVGPGSVYTSIVPALLPEGMSEALAGVKERGGDLTLVANLVTEPTETDGWTAGRYLQVTEKAAGTEFTEVVVNDNTVALPEDRAVRYDRDEFRDRKHLKVYATDLVKDEEIIRDANDPMAAYRAKVTTNMGAAAIMITSKVSVSSM